MIKTYLRLVAAVAALAAVAAAAIWFLVSRPRESVEVSRGSVADISPMVRLCSVDIYSEVPVRDTVNGKVIFGVQKQRGSISFDVDSLPVDTSADTLRVALPREIVEVNEATDKDSWRVIDTKNLKWYRSDRLSDAEDNLVKRRLRERAVRRLYADGTVARARAEARTNLASLLGRIYRRPVVVTDDSVK